MKSRAAIGKLKRIGAVVGVTLFLGVVLAAALASRNAQGGAALGDIQFKYRVTVENTLSEKDRRIRENQQILNARADLVAAKKSEDFIDKFVVEFKKELSVLLFEYDATYSRRGEDHYYEHTPVNKKAIASGDKLFVNLLTRGNTYSLIGSTLRIYRNKNLETVIYPPMFMDGGLGIPYSLEPRDPALFKQAGIPEDAERREVLDPHPSKEEIGRYLPAVVEYDGTGKRIVKAVIGHPKAPMAEWRFSDFGTHKGREFARTVVWTSFVEVEGRIVPDFKTTMRCEEVSSEAVIPASADIAKKMKAGDPLILVADNGHESLLLYDQYNPEHRAYFRSAPGIVSVLTSLGFAICGGILAYIIFWSVGERRRGRA